MEELSSEELFGADFGSERMWGLKELMLPTESFSPQTIGWLYLGALILALIIIIAWRRYQSWKRQAYRREALQLLAQINRDASLIHLLPKLLRHAALMIAPRSEVNALKGAQWTAWLNQRVGQPVFNEEDANLLMQLPYAREPSIDDLQSQHLIKAAQVWVEGHHA